MIYKPGVGFGLPFGPTPGAFDGPIYPHHREFAISKKKKLVPGGWPGGMGTVGRDLCINVASVLPGEEQLYGIRTVFT